MPFRQPNQFAPFAGSRRPLWPFTVNEDSPQYEGLVFWQPVIGPDASKGSLAVADQIASVVGSPVLTSETELGFSFLHSGTSAHSFAHLAKYNVSIPFAVSIWVNFTGTTNRVVFEKNGNSGFSLQTQSGGSSMLISVGGNSPVDNVAVNDGTWHHVFVEVVSTSATVNWWIDGILNTNGSTVPVAPTYGSSTPVYTGSRNGAAGFTGRLADARLYQTIWPNPRTLWEPRTRWDLYRPNSLRFVAGGSGTTPVSNAVSVPVEWLQGIAAAVSIPLEWLQGIGGAVTVPVEWLQGIANPVNVPEEWLQGISTGGVTVCAEWIGSLTQGVTVPDEWLGGIAGAGSIPVEWVSIIQANQTAVAEWLSGIVPAGATLPVEMLGGIGQSSTTAVEWLAAIQAAGLLPIEILGHGPEPDAIWVLDARGSTFVLDTRGNVWQLDQRPATSLEIRR